VGCELDGGESAETGVGLADVIVGPASLDDPAGLPEALEQVLGEALVAETSVEAFDGAVLPRLSGRDVMPVDPAFLLLLENGVRGQLRAVVEDDHAGITSIGGDAAEFSSDADTRDRRIDHEAKTFPREVFNHGQNAEAPVVVGRMRPR
tara:strand:+ start:8388 stop:8834 length:447 start_codon:yes stop_codon:yes gene_type:complete